MKDKCIDIGILQGFVDGELSDNRVEEVVRHLSLCDSCPAILADLESEGDLVFAALESEHNVLVPTERLRTKLFASINEIESGRSSGFGTRLLAGLNSLFLSPGFASAAGVVLIAAVFMVGFRAMYPDQIATPEVTVTNDASNLSASVQQEVAAESPESPAVVADEGLVNDIQTPQIQEIQANEVDRPATASYAVYRQEPGRETRIRSGNTARAVVTPRLSADLDAEDGYLTTISTLNRTVNESKDYVLRPSERVTFERNLAVVDDAIKNMKKEVRTNPDNTAAREVLRSSYKNKISLLNSVAERTETVAGLN